MGVKVWIWRHEHVIKTTCLTKQYSATLLERIEIEITFLPGYDCRKRCVGSADVQWPQSVGSGILKVNRKVFFYGCEFSLTGF